ncbi:MAG TPA: (2Fe-2S)-binding protein [Tepidisphaeraceae bacterium]|jgi:aerobic-type carbon monoxide dehydrogenase small subunit (CoxS/CutS family)
MADGNQVTLTVNGQAKSVPAAPDRPLLEVLRENLRMSGTHYGCGAGQCGACSVLIDGRREFSCQLQLSDVDGKSITTVEGLAKGDTLHPVQQAFLDVGGFQCGYCTPGMIITLVGQLNENPQADDATVLKAMENNLCRCCGYAKISEGICKAAAAARGGAR